jgi:hypothetical protein
VRPPAVQAFSGALEDGLRRELVYGGDLLVFKGVEPMVGLCALTDELIRETLGSLDPVGAQFELNREDYVATVGELQRLYRRHGRAKRLLFAALGSVGVDLRRTCWDWLHLRVLPHGEGEADRRTGRLGIHRDTWASNVYAQTNWWAPIYRISADRTVAFYPGYWSRPVKNTSGDWDLEEIRAQKSRGAPTKPAVPEPSEPVDPASELRVVIEPGDLLCFSGAHLHAGVPNSTGVARFSVEARTVDAEDVALGRGAPNVDGAAPHVALSWFHSVERGTSLQAAVQHGGCAQVKR